MFKKRRRKDYGPADEYNKQAETLIDFISDTLFRLDRVFHCYIFVQMGN
jgi:hypothetical protein